MDLVEAIANYASTKADKPKLERMLDRAINIIAKTYNVPDDQVKQLRSEATALFDAYPAKRDGDATNG